MRGRKRKPLNWRKYVFSLPVGIITGILVSILGFLHPVFFVAGGLVLILYTLPVVVGGAFLLAVFDPEDHNGITALVLLVAIFVPWYVFIHGLNLL